MSGRAAFSGLQLLSQAPQQNIIDEAIWNTDRGGRERFVKDLIARAKRGYPHHYVMVVNAASSYHPQTRDNAEDFFVRNGGGTYRVIIFKSGKFDLYTDGGWINWGFTGGRRSGIDGKHVEW